MKHQEMIDLVREISLPGYHFVVFLKMGLTFLYMEPEDGKCAVSGEPMLWKSRKHYLSPHMTRSEIVQTVFLCAKTAWEHELREAFLYKGVTVFDPHFDLDHIVLLKSERVDTRGLQNET